MQVGNISAYSGYSSLLKGQIALNSNKKFAEKKPVHITRPSYIETPAKKPDEQVEKEKKAKRKKTLIFGAIALFGLSLINAAIYARNNKNFDSSELSFDIMAVLDELYDLR